MFESVLNYMYRFHCDPRAEHKLPDGSAESDVGVLWFVGRLGMTGLQQQVVEHLEGAVTEQSAAAYVGAAMRQLGLVKVREAAAGLGRSAAGVFDRLPLEAMEQLVGMAGQ